MESNGNGERAVHETKASLEFIKANWRDSLGEQYIRWLEQTLQELGKVERNMECIRLQAEKIRLLCEEISSSEGDMEQEPKVLRRRR